MNITSTSRPLLPTSFLIAVCYSWYFSSIFQVFAFNGNNNNNNVVIPIIRSHNRYHRHHRCAIRSLLVFATTVSIGEDDGNNNEKPGRVGRFLNRFRKKKNIIQEEIRIGDMLPDIDVEVVAGVLTNRDTDNDNAVNNIDDTNDANNSENIDIVNINEIFGVVREEEKVEDEDEQEATEKEKKTAATARTQVLVGMPGAYTPTCTNVHLPGFKESLFKLQKLGVDTIAIVTTNDRYVNGAWAKDLGIEKDGDTNDTISKAAAAAVVAAEEEDESKDKKKNEKIINLNNDEEDSPIIILSDGDAELVRAIGLAEDMGFGIGIRSKRFALILQEGVVTDILTDEGMDECENTTAEKLVELLTPEVEDTTTSTTSNDGGSIELTDEQKNILLGVGGIVVAIELFNTIPPGH